MSATVGASTNLDDSGAWAQTYRMVRSLTLLGAKAAGVVARAGPVPADRPELQVCCKHTMPTCADCDFVRTVATFFWARAEQAGTKVCSDSASCACNRLAVQGDRPGQAQPSPLPPPP